MSYTFIKSTVAVLKFVRICEKGFLLLLFQYFFVFVCIFILLNLALLKTSKTRADRVYWYKNIIDHLPKCFHKKKISSISFVSFIETSMFIFTAQTGLLIVVEKSCRGQVMSFTALFYENNNKKFLISDHTDRWAHEYAETSSLHRGANNKKKRFGLSGLSLTFVTY